MPISSMRWPQRRARKSSSTSKPQPSRVCAAARRWAMSVRISLKPHCESWMPGSAKRLDDGVEDATHQVAMIRLAVATRIRPLAHGNGDFGMRQVRRQELGDLGDGHREVGVADEGVLAARRQQARADRAALAAMRRADQPQRAPVLRAVRDELGGVVAAAVVHHDHLGGVGLAVEVSAHSLERAWQALALVVGGNHDGE